MLYILFSPLKIEKSDTWFSFVKSRLIYPYGLLSKTYEIENPINASDSL